MKKLVSVIICTRNRCESLQQTLESVSRLQIPDDLRAELVVVDNASEDATPSAVAAFKPAHIAVRLVTEPAAGLSRARNTGVAAANGAIILFTDDDVRLPSDWLEQMCRPLLTGSVDAVAGSVKLAPHLERPWMTPLHRATLAATDLVDFADPGVLMGANMGVAAHVFENVPRFDPELGAGALGTAEDTLFAWQLLEAGYRIGGVETSCVVHHCDASRLSRRSFMDAARKLGRSYAYIYYHWQQRTPRWATGSTLSIWRRLVRCGLRWVYWRGRRWKECRRSEGIPEWEFNLIIEFNNVRQHLNERSRSRNYDLRGLLYRPRTEPQAVERRLAGPMQIQTQHITPSSSSSSLEST